MWELVCEGHWGSHSVMQQASNRQANKTRPGRSSAAEGKKLWIMMGIIYKSCCHISVSELQGTNPHTHALPQPPPWIPCGPILAISIMGPEWHIFSNTAMRKFIKRLNHCPGNGADTETNTSRNGYRHLKWAFLWWCFFFLQCVCVCVKNNVE